MTDPTRRRIVEGEPGIFPAPIASVLRAFGRLFTRDKQRSTEETASRQDVEKQQEDK